MLERYDAGRPWVLLNVGIIGLQLQRPETDGCSDSFRLFFQRRSNYWLVAELIANRGSLERETAFDESLIAAVMHTISAAVATKERTRSSSLDNPYPGLAPEALLLRRQEQQHVSRPNLAVHSVRGPGGG